MDVAGMIKRARGSANYPVTRMIADGSYDQTTNKGAYVPGATAIVTINCSFQPAAPEDIVTLPEGDRTKEAFRVYAFPAVLNLDTTRLRIGDSIPFHGANYLVNSVEHWPTFSKAIVVRVNTDAN